MALIKKLTIGKAKVEIHSSVTPEESKKNLNRYVDDYASHESFLENSISIPKYKEITIHTIKNKPWRQITYINNNYIGRM